MINRTRSMTILCGLGLAAALFALLSLAGVGIQRKPADRGEPGPAPVGDAQIASQPALRQAMLTAADLPPGYADRPAPARSGERSARVPECRALFERLALPGAPAPLLGDPVGALRQAVTAFAPGAEAGAADAYTALRTASDRCPNFRATLDDGTDVTVQMTESARLAEVVASERSSAEGASDAVGVVASERSSAEGASDAVGVVDAFLVRLTVTTAGRKLTGYLSAGRVGRVVSVLRHLGPEGTIRVDDASTLLRRALAKIEILDGLQRHKPT